jgi:hypothetical protein
MINHFSATAFGIIGDASFSTPPRRRNAYCESLIVHSPLSNIGLSPTLEDDSAVDIHVQKLMGVNAVTPSFKLVKAVSEGTISLSLVPTTEDVNGFFLVNSLKESVFYIVPEHARAPFERYVNPAYFKFAVGDSSLDDVTRKAIYRGAWPVHVDIHTNICRSLNDLIQRVEKAESSLKHFRTKKVLGKISQSITKATTLRYLCRRKEAKAKQRHNGRFVKSGTVSLMTLTDPQAFFDAVPTLTPVCSPRVLMDFNQPFDDTEVDFSVENIGLSDHISVLQHKGILDEEVEENDVTSDIIAFFDSTKSPVPPPRLPKTPGTPPVVQKVASAALTSPPNFWNFF